MFFKPLGDRIAVKRLEAEAKTPGGIILPDNAKEKPLQAEVIAVGPGLRNEKGEHIALDVQVGDVVMFAKWAGTEVTLEGQEVLIMKESDVMGVVADAASKKKVA